MDLLHTFIILIFNNRNEKKKIKLEDDTADCTNNFEVIRRLYEP